MKPAATIADDDIGTEIQRIPSYKKPQLLAEWNKMDPSQHQHSISEQRSSNDSSAIYSIIRVLEHSILLCHKHQSMK